ncbi:NAD(+) kinase [Campylobacter sp. 19-13652]|uniref:NAD(+) kinase n=1 Tax=Campylobacter sp. 19-13652 TaxID=2840180 RepID=UPI001C75D8A0|nr:NAD(+) kinase [Campylobacter sp. 19-13652]BCX79062.1 NAD kinase [Campylobacter sp. 19-13652]
MKNENINLNGIKKVGLVVREGESMTHDMDLIFDILSRFGVEVLCEQKAALAVGKNGYLLDELARQCALIISLGGDGTLISLARKTAAFAPLLLGIHTGRLGFLTEATLGEADELFKELFNNKFVIERPYFLRVVVEQKNGKNMELLALNDAVIMRRRPASTVNIKAYLGGKHFNSYFGDGIIACTPTGSTAYNMSAGGALIYPLSAVFSLTPICSHSLSQRPLILPFSETVSLSADSNSELVIDGQESLSMQDVACVKVGLGDVRARFLRREGRDYFQILKQKLRWGDK